jgi:Flp pilus assembly protein CpaB
MSRRLIFFVFTGALALMAALLVRSALKSREAKIAALRETTVQIVVAARGLAPGETIDASAIRLTSWPREQVPPGAFTELGPVMGKVVKDSFGVNQPLVGGALLEPEKTGGVLPLLIPPGQRAMSIAVDDVTDMAGFVLPHSRVDVLVSVTVGGPGNGPGAIGEVTKIVLQNIKVLAVAQTLEAGPDQPAPGQGGDLAGDAVGIRAPGGGQPDRHVVAGDAQFRRPGRVRDQRRHAADPARPARG